MEDRSRYIARALSHENKKLIHKTSMIIPKETIDDLKINQTRIKRKPFDTNNLKNINKKILKNSHNLEDLITKTLLNIAKDNSTIQENLPFKKISHQQISFSNFEYFFCKSNSKNEITKKELSLVHPKKLFFNKSIPINDILIQEKQIQCEHLSQQYHISFSGNNLIQQNPSRDLFKFQNVYDSISDEEYIEISHNYANFIILPNSTFRKSWEYLITLLIILSCIFTPLSICFNYDSFNFLFWIECLIELFFIIDCFMNFFLAYIDKNDNLVLNFYLIFRNYIFNSLFLDFISSVPILNIGLFYSAFSYNKSTINMTISRSSPLRWFVSLRILKLNKFEYIKNLKLNNNFKLNRILKSTVIFFYLTHISACIWIFIGHLNENTGNSWISSNFKNTTSLDLYISSLYFILVTTFTVGYGDIVATNYIERAFNIYLLIIGVNLYTYAVSNLSSLFSEIAPKRIIFDQKSRLLEDLQDEYFIPEKLEKSIKQSILLGYKKNQSDKYTLLEILPRKLKNELIISMNSNLIQNLKFFKNQNYDFILFVLQLLKSHKLEKNETLFSVGEIVQEMYFVVKGTLSVNLGSYYGYLEIGRIIENEHFGDLLVQTNECSPFELKAKTRSCEVLMLDKLNFIEIKKNFNEKIIQILKDSLKILESFDKRRQQYMKLIKFESSIDRVQNILKIINQYLIKKGFDDYFNKDVDFEDLHDFIEKHEIKDIIKLIQTILSKDFQKCQIIKNIERLNKSECLHINPDLISKMHLKNISMKIIKKNKNSKSLKLVTFNKQITKNTGKSKSIQENEENNSINRSKTFQMINQQHILSKNKDMSLKSNMGIELIDMTPPRKNFLSKTKSSQMKNSKILKKRLKISTHFLSAIDKNFHPNSHFLKEEKEINEKAFHLLNYNKKQKSFLTKTENSDFDYTSFFDSKRIIIPKFKNEEECQNSVNTLISYLDKNQLIILKNTLFKKSEKYFISHESFEILKSRKQKITNIKVNNVIKDNSDIKNIEKLNLNEKLDIKKRILDPGKTKVRSNSQKHIFISNSKPGIKKNDLNSLIHTFKLLINELKLNNN